MKEDAEGRRNEKKAAEIKAMRMLREGEKLKIELNKVREAAAKQANVLKRKAAEALAKQRIVAEQRKRQAIKTGAPASKSNTGSGIDKTRKKDLKTWMFREIENMTMVMSTKEQLNEQATLRAAAAKKRESFADKRGMTGVHQQVKMLDIEVETRTGVICQLQRSLMELEREAKTNTLNINDVDAERFAGMNRIECRFMLQQFFDELIAAKLQVENLEQTKKKGDEDAIDKAVEAERARGRTAIKQLKFEHSEAMMTLLEGTKGVVEHKVGLQVMESGAGGVVDADLKASVDEMLGGFLEGFTRVGDELFNEFENLKEDDRKEKERLEKKLQREKEKKKMKKIIWKPKEQEEELFEDDFMDDGEIDEEDDSDWAETPAKKRPKKSDKVKSKAEVDSGMDTSIIEDEIVQMLSDDTEDMEKGEIEKEMKEKKKKEKKEKKEKKAKKGIDETNGAIIEEEKLEKMKVAELKGELKKRGLLVGGKKDELQQRLRDFFADIKDDDAKDMDVSADSSLNSSMESTSSVDKSGATIDSLDSTAEAAPAEAAQKSNTPRRMAGDELSLTPYAQKVKKVYLFDNKMKKEVGGENGTTTSNIPKKVVHLGTKSTASASESSSSSNSSSSNFARPTTAPAATNATSTVPAATKFSTYAKLTTKPSASTTTSTATGAAALSKDERARKLQEWKESKRNMGGSSSSGSLGLPVKKAPSALGGAKRRIDHVSGGEGKKIRRDLSNVTNSLNELSKVMNGLEKKTAQQGGFRNTPTKKKSQVDKPKFNF